MKFEKPPGLITSSVAAKMGGVGRFRVWQLAALGEFKAVQVPGYPVLLDEASVRAWVARRNGAPAGAGKRKQTAAR